MSTPSQEHPTQAQPEAKPSTPESPQQTPPDAPTPQMLPKNIVELLTHIPAHYTPQGFSVATALWNVSLLFTGTRVVRDISTGNIGTVDLPEAVVMLSWEQAKGLLASLRSAIDAYEETQCTINMPKLYTDALAKHTEEEQAKKEKKDAK